MKTVVLLVDDEIPFVETMTKRLTKRDLMIISAHSGPEALAKLDQETLGLVVVLIQG